MNWNQLWRKLWGLITGVGDAGDTPILITVTKTFKETGYQMKMIRLIRKIFTNNSTIGQFSFDDFSCWTLELPERKVDEKLVCIPPGTYLLEWRWSEKHQMNLPGLKDVPGRNDIEIHPGNYPKDTLGCILLGEDHQVDFITNSKRTCAKVFPLIQKVLSEGDLSINIIG